MDSESIDYQALYTQLQGEIERLKLDMWASKQRYSLQRIMARIFNALAARLADMTTVEWIAAACIVSIALHYHYKVWKDGIKA